MTKTVHIAPLRIAPLEPDQVDRAVALRGVLWHAAYGPILPTRLAEQRTEDHFRSHLESRAGNSWLAWSGDRLVGLCTTSSNCIDDVWVSQQHRRRGIASRLIATACRHLAQRGFRAAQAGCEDFNLAASALFEHLGWRRVGSELVHIAPGMRHEAIVYTRPLSLQEAS